MLWMPFLVAGLMLLVADAAGWIDLSTRPLLRVIKWLVVAAWAWFMPMLVKKIFHFELNPELLNIWKLIILGVLMAGLLSALVKWIWWHYGPAPEGHRRCPRCSIPVLKVMLECPHCRHALQSQK